MLLLHPSHELLLLVHVGLLLGSHELVTHSTLTSHGSEVIVHAHSHHLWVLVHHHLLHHHLLLHLLLLLHCVHVSLVRVEPSQIRNELGLLLLFLRLLLLLLGVSIEDTSSTSGLSGFTLASSEDVHSWLLLLLLLLLRSRKADIIEEIESISASSCGSRLGRGASS